MPPSKIAILVSLSQFEVALPDAPSVTPETFSNDSAGVRSFVSWAKPKLLGAGPTDEPVKICLLGAEAIEATTRIEDAVTGSLPPVSELEPFDASIRLLSEGERSRGITKRGLADAIRYCRGERL